MTRVMPTVSDVRRPQCLVKQANRQLMHLRQSDPKAGGLVIAMDQNHAKGIAEMLYEMTRVMPTVATSTTPMLRRRSRGFPTAKKSGLSPSGWFPKAWTSRACGWGFMPQTRPRTCSSARPLGVWCGGRGAGERQTAYMFIPDDPRLRTFAAKIAEQRQHSLRKKDDPNGGRFRPQRAAGGKEKGRADAR